MTLGKITIDNRVKFIAQSEQTQSISRESKTKTLGNISLSREQDNKFSPK